MSGGNSVLSRRSFVAKLAAGGAAVAATAAIGRASAATTRNDSGEQLEPNSHAAAAPAPVTEAAPPSLPPWEILRPLALGSTVAEGWHISALSGADAGSCVLTLQNARGRNHRIHLCRNDGQPQGMVYTRQFDLLVMNGGAGEMPTEEGLAQAVAAVAHAVAANEAAEPVEQLASALLPQSERVARYSAGRQLR